MWLAIEAFHEEKFKEENHENGEGQNRHRMEKRIYKLWTLQNERERSSIFIFSSLSLSVAVLLLEILPTSTFSPTQIEMQMVY